MERSRTALIIIIVLQARCIYILFMVPKSVKYYEQVEYCVYMRVRALRILSMQYIFLYGQERIISRICIFDHKQKICLEQRVLLNFLFIKFTKKRRYFNDSKKYLTVLFVQLQLNAEICFQRNFLKYIQLIFFWRSYFGYSC